MGRKRTSQLNCGSPAPETAAAAEPAPTYWLLHRVPGWLSVREVESELGSGYSVVDRMLGLQMVVLKRQGGADTGLPRLPRRWMHECCTTVTRYDERQVRQSQRRSDDTDVVIVHCLKKGVLTLDDALASLEAMRFPLKHVLRVFLGSCRPAHSRDRRRDQYSLDLDRGATLHQIYVQMQSVAHARGVVPGTNPLQPRFDAVVCEETSSVLHVLQRSNKPFEEKRAAHVHELSSDARKGRCPLSGRTKTTVSVVAEAAAAAATAAGRPPRVPAAALKRRQEQEALAALEALEALEAEEEEEVAAARPLVDAAAASAAASAVAAVFATPDEKRAAAAAEAETEAEAKADAKMKQALASASGSRGEEATEPPVKYVFRFMKPAEKAAEKKVSAAAAAPVSAEERKRPEATQAAAAASPAPAPATPALHVPSSVPLRWADDSCTVASSSCGGGGGVCGGGGSGDARSVRGDVAEYTHPSSAASVLPPLEMMASEEWPPADAAAEGTIATACGGYPPLGAWGTTTAAGTGAGEMWSLTPEAEAEAAAAAQYPPSPVPQAYCGAEHDLAEQTAAIMNFYAQLAYHHVRSMTGGAAAPFPPPVTPSGFPYGGDFAPPSQPARSQPPPLCTTAAPAPTAPAPAPAAPLAGEEAAGGDASCRRRCGDSSPGASTTGDAAIGLRMVPLRMPPAVAAAAAAAAAGGAAAASDASRPGSRACSGSAAEKAPSLLVQSLPAVTWQRESADSTLAASAGVALWRTCCSLGGEGFEEAAAVSGSRGVGGARGGSSSGGALCKTPKKVTLVEEEDIAGEACTQTELTLEMLDELVSGVRC